MSELVIASGSGTTCDLFSDKPSARRPSEDSNNLSKLIDDPLMSKSKIALVSCLSSR